MSAFTGRDIICCSTHYWAERWFRKQEFMSRFARANRVLYVEPSFTMARGPDAYMREFADNRFLLSRVEPRAGGITLLRPPRGIPKWSLAPIERVNYRWFGHVVNRTARRLGFKRPVAWVYRPAFLYGLPAIDHDRLVVDVVDDWAAYGGGHSEHMDATVRGLAARSDLLVVTAPTLLERYGRHARRAVHIPNGFDAQRFSLTVPAVPAALLELPRPLLGFVGTLFGFLDFELLEGVARVHHDKSLVLVGPVEGTARAALQRLLGLPNVFHLGAQPQAEIPAYVGAFDVCLSPFREGRVADSISPLKVYEYLAMGRPVVSSPMRSLQMEPGGAVVAFASGVREFCEQVDRCLTDAVQSQVDERRAAVEGYSWERLFERLDAAVADALS